MIKLPKIGDLVKNEQVAELQRVDYEGTLWYKVKDTSFEFFITKDEAKGGVFRRDEKAIHLMRWIRKTIDLIKEELEKEEHHA